MQIAQTMHIVCDSKWQHDGLLMGLDFHTDALFIPAQLCMEEVCQVAIWILSPRLTQYCFAFCQASGIVWHFFLALWQQHTPASWEALHVILLPETV